ncbi:MAG: hypothetical protein QF501_01455 [Anaerolineales bacterium]|jgi:hypothetical protein|nr:hypothetical protein [Anaerolineales bacterium]|tara:strand:+ start:2437 stop:3015 length:579 start_codon:yes stop_codon:yes gene_type:complete
MEYPEEESTNRPFIIASVALGGLFVAGLVALGLYAFKIRPAQASASATQVAEINASNTQVAEYAEATSVAQVAAVMVPESEQQARLAAAAGSESSGAVVVVAPAEPVAVAQLAEPSSSVSGSAASTNKVASRGNSNVAVAATAIPVVAVSSADALPDTGFADEVGIPVLLFTALGLLSVVIVTRSVRRLASG